MISAAMAAGAQGYISKSLGREALVDSLRRMWEGEHVTPEGYEPENAGEGDAARADLARRFASLTPQQMKILRLICQGKANKEISYELSIAEATVKTHITAIMSKINARRHTQAVLLANHPLAQGLAQLEQRHGRLPRRLAFVGGGGEQVFALDLALQVEGEPTLGVGLVVFLVAHRLDAGKALGRRRPAYVSRSACQATCSVMKVEMKK